MPGKVNPVIPESVAQAAMQVVANDQLLTQACMKGNLELNQFMPAIADALLGSLQLLTDAAIVITSYSIHYTKLYDFLMGVLVETSALFWSPGPALRAMIAVGFLGALTTFSSFV